MFYVEIVLCDNLLLVAQMVLPQYQQLSEVVRGLDKTDFILFCYIRILIVAFHLYHLERTAEIYHLI